MKDLRLTILNLGSRVNIRKINESNFCTFLPKRGWRKDFKPAKALCKYSPVGGKRGKEGGGVPYNFRLKLSFETLKKLSRRDFYNSVCLN